MVCERGEVAGTRLVPGLGQAVGIGEVRVAQAKLAAMRFISAMNPGRHRPRRGLSADRLMRPPKCSARATAASLPEGRRRPRTARARAAARLPRRSVEPIVSSARLENVTDSSRTAGSFSASRRTTKAVMILVVLAISTRLASSWPQESLARPAVGDRPGSSRYKRRSGERIRRACFFGISAFHHLRRRHCRFRIALFADRLQLSAGSLHHGLTGDEWQDEERGQNAKPR